MPVNDATFNANLVANYLNETYKQAVTSWQVIDGGDYQVNQDVLNELDEGESGLLASFPRNMRQFIRDYKRNITNYDKDVYYVFIIEGANADRAGFMPFKRQFGFVFSDKTPNLERTIAHELGHVEPCEIPSSGALGERRFGRAFRLRHTFSSKDFIAEQGDTDNLMDYSQGNHLHKQQWDYIHDPQAVIGWFEDDEEGEYTNEDIITFGVSKIDLTKYGFITPSGVGFLLPASVEKIRCHKKSGALYEFDYNEQTYAYVEVGGKGFSGYLSKEKIKDLGLTKGTIASEELQVRITSNRFDISEMEDGKIALAVVQEFVNFDYYSDCICAYKWTYESDGISIYSTNKFGTIPVEAEKFQCVGPECDLSDISDGPGGKLQLYVLRENRENGIEFSAQQNEEFNELVKWLDDTVRGFNFVFYVKGISLLQDKESIKDEILAYIYDNNLMSLAAFKDHFYISFSRDIHIIFSTVELRNGIPENYNEKSVDYINGGKYEYSFDDLRYRERYSHDNDILFKAILAYERNQDAQPMATHENYKQYVAKFGTNSAMFAWAEFAARTSKPLLQAYMIYRFVPQIIGQIGARATLQRAIKNLSKKQAEDFVKGAVMEATMYLFVSELTDEEINWADFAADVIMAGLRNTVKLNNDQQAIAACITGVNLATVDRLINNDNDELIMDVALLSIECIVPYVIEKKLGVKGNQLYNAISNSSTTKIVDFLTKIKLPSNIQTKIIFTLNNLSHLANLRGSKWIEEMNKLLPTENGSKAFQILLNSKFDISKISWRNFKRLSVIASKLDAKGLIDLQELFQNTYDINRMLIFLEKGNLSVDNYKVILNQIISSDMFNNTITLSGGKTISQKEFLLNYTDNSLIDYYHKTTIDKFMFAKYHKETEQVLMIVIDNVNKVFLDAESRLIINNILQELNEYKLMKLWTKLFCNIGMISISFLLIILIYYYPNIFGCLDFLIYLLLLFILLFPYFTYKFLNNIGLKGWSKEITAILIIVVFILSYNKFNKFIKKNIGDNGGVVIPALVINKYSYYNTPNKIELHYTINEDIKYYSFIVEDELYKEINSGDTIIIIYSSMCNDWKRPFDFTPSPELIQKCKKGCFYKDGKIVEEL